MRQSTSATHRLSKLKNLPNIAVSQAEYTTRRIAYSMAAEQPGNSLQHLYDLAKQDTTGARSQERVQELCKALNKIPLDELGFDPNLVNNSSAPGLLGPRPLRHTFAPPVVNRSPVTYLHIHEDSNMTIGVFCLPANTRIPLHDHPGMTVLSRLLYGTLHIRAYDWVTPCTPAIPGGVRSARLVTDRVLSAPADPSVLFPTNGGNIHSFTALSPCAILDVLTPPYGEGRDCTYYREHFLKGHVRESGDIVSESGATQKGGLVVGLEEFEPPDDFYVIRGRYAGKHIIP